MFSSKCTRVILILPLLFLSDKGISLVFADLSRTILKGLPPIRVQPRGDDKKIFLALRSEFLVTTLDELPVKGKRRMANLVENQWCLGCFK
ncbi:hypothetical protein CEE45_10290 [Candidatus Heimdallarchaeota archaeon B3_Heim]|nr:MAG: hypothetical protein CEE45_10290 [Candidatus Heimdallarchaeota archaeon B3_Heim]